MEKPSLEVQEKMKETDMQSDDEKTPKKSLGDIFDSFEDSIQLDESASHEVRDNPEAYRKAFHEKFGVDPYPYYSAFAIHWSEKGRGFGSYTFWMEDGKIYCDNECDSRATIKRILSKMVDQAILSDEEPKPKKASPEDNSHGP